MYALLHTNISLLNISIHGNQVGFACYLSLLALGLIVFQLLSVLCLWVSPSRPDVEIHFYICVPSVSLILQYFVAHLLTPVLASLVSLCCQDC